MPAPIPTLPTNRTRRLALAAAVAFALTPFLGQGQETSAERRGVSAPAGGVGSGKLSEFKGKVLPLAGLLEKHGARLDADAAPHWLALLADDGTVYPLIKDGGARLFYTDKRLLDRPMRLTGRLVPGTQLLQVLAVGSYLKGELHDLYYWCEVCSIRRSEQGICECCGGPMELQEVPVRK